MKYLDIDMSISFNEELTEEEMDELIEYIVSYILKQKNIKGVGYDSKIRESSKINLNF